MRADDNLRDALIVAFAGDSELDMTISMAEMCADTALRVIKDWSTDEPHEKV